MAKVLVPVTAARASVRPCGVPTTVRSEASLRVTEARVVVVAAALLDSSPKVSALPRASVMTPALIVRDSTVAPRAAAAALSSCCRARAAAIRIGV